MARPKKQIDEKQVENLAAINCSYAEMAAVLNCSSDTLERRFAEVIKKGRERGTMSLKRKQYEIAVGGNVTMLIWLGKQMLGQREKYEQKIETIGDPLSVTKQDMEKLSSDLINAVKIQNEIGATNRIVATTGLLKNNPLEFDPEYIAQHLEEIK